MSESIFSKKIKTEYLSALALVFILLPFCLLCFFAHPSFVDDYCFATKTLEMGFTNAFLDWYINWTGRYSLCFLMSLNFSFIGSLFLYRVILFLLIALFPVLIYFLLVTIFKKQSQGFYTSHVALFSVLYFYQLPSVNEGLYWMTGSIAYQMPTLCLLGGLIVLFNIFVNKGNRLLNCLILSFLLVIMIGANEISMATIDVFLFLIIVHRLVFRLKKKQELFIVFAVCMIASFFVIQAPGNYVRGELFPLAKDWMWAIRMTFLGFGYYMFQWVGLSCLVAIISLYILGKVNLSLPSTFFISSKWTISIFLLVMLTGFFVPAWSTGQMPNPRAINVLFSIFIIGLFYHVFVFYHLFHEHDSFLSIGKIAVWLSICSVFFITFSSGRNVINNIKTAYMDILSGNAYHFDRSMINLYKSEKWDGTLFTHDLPQSISWEISEENYKGYPEQYFKVHAK